MSQAVATQTAEFEPGPALRLTLAAFVALLRDKGFRIGPSEAADAGRLVTGASGQRAAMLRPALKALFCGRRSDWVAFDALFDAHFLRKGMKKAVALAGSAGESGGVRTLKQMQDEQAARRSSPAVDVSREAEAPEAGEEDPAGTREGASRAENLAETDFRKIRDPELEAEAHRLAERLALVMRRRLTRRDRIRSGGPRLDLRRTLRKSVARGGLPLDLVRKGPKLRQLRLVVLLDASGSMNNYTGVFVRFVHGLLDAFRQADAFLFHTRLVHVSSALKERDAARALDRLGLMAQGVGGGTRIGAALADFNRWHAARVLTSRSCVIILSDGYDTGPAEEIGAEMARLARRCRRIVWLNPLLGSDGYAPVAAGMAAALPHVDLFAPGHNLKSLAALEPYLAKV
ncbi:MAG: vWA domain-containing protein [Pannonibacter sp.]